jgi:hypothetical protein
MSISFLAKRKKKKKKKKKSKIQSTSDMVGKGDDDKTNPNNALRYYTFPTIPLNI